MIEWVFKICDQIGCWLDTGHEYESIHYQTRKGKITSVFRKKRCKLCGKIKW